MTLLSPNFAVGGVRLNTVSSASQKRPKVIVTIFIRYAYIYFMDSYKNIPMD